MTTLPDPHPADGPATPPVAAIWRDWAPATRATAVALAALVGAFAWNVWPDWRHNPDLSHGLFAPAIFLLLMWEGTRDGAPRWLRPDFRLTIVHLAAVVGGVLLFAFAGLIAASVGWSHALVNFALACALSALMLAGLLYLGGETVRAVPVNWTTLTAACLWVLAAPIPSGTYARLTLKLQILVTTSVLKALHLLGVPARQSGNLIELATTTVGIEDACSGIRSLISCVFAGCFFAAWQVRRPGARVALILLAPALAVGMNFVRSLTLTLLANARVNIAGFWHDVTGYGILVVTAGVLAVLAMALESPAPAAVAAAGRAPATPERAGAGRLLAILWTGVASVAALATFFAVQSRPPARLPGPPPVLASMFPPTFEGWQALPAPNLNLFSATLLTEYLAQRTYVKTAGTTPLQVTFYVGYWPPGQASVSSVASHTPEACWPGAGWTPVRADAGQPKPSLPGRSLPPGEYRLFSRNDGYLEHVWFWHIYDGRALAFVDPYSVPALLKLAWRYGYRRQGDQVFVRISSNQPWPVLASEPLVQQIITNLGSLGL